MNELGYVEGRNFVIESRWAEGDMDRLPALVAALLAQKLDIVFAPSAAAAQAIKKSGATIPIVFGFALEMVINLKAAQPMGIKSPQSLLLPADRTID